MIDFAAESFQEPRPGSLDRGFSTLNQLAFDICKPRRKNGGRATERSKDG
jgi:hypothetical protein